MHTRKSAESKLSAMKGIHVASFQHQTAIPCSHSRGVRPLRDIPTLGKQLDDRKLQIVERRTQRSHVVKRAARLVSISKTGSIPQAPPIGGRSTRGAPATSKNSCQGSHRIAGCLNSSPGVNFGNQGATMTS